MALKRCPTPAFISETVLVPLLGTPVKLPGQVFGVDVKLLGNLIKYPVP